MADAADSPAPPTSRPARKADRDTAQHVRAARDKLSHGTTLKPEFELELLSMFVRNEQKAFITLPLLALIFMFALMFWAPWRPEALIWFVLVIATKLHMQRACRAFQKLPQSEIKLDHWRRKFALSELISGLSWAGMAVVGSTVPDVAPHVFVLAAMIVLLAIRMAFASTVLQILHLGTVPMTVAVVVRLGWQAYDQKQLFFLAIGFMAIGLHIYFISLAKSLHATALHMLEYRAEKDSLIAELEEEKAISDEARHQAEGANVAKSRFLATMSHELRTPLNAILGFSEVMQTELLGPMQNPHYKEYATNIHDSGRHLLHLINEILDLSRIEAGRYELHEVSLRLTDVVEDCHRLLKLRAEGKGLTLSLQFETDLPQLWADERAVRQICLNLMSNAIKFTPRGGRVVAGVSMNAEMEQILSIRDNGPGIPKEEIPKVLQAFGQGSLAHQTAEGGTGLGLPIVQSLVDLHGGRFDLISELRKGTIAVVAFPKSRVMQAMPPLQRPGQERHKQPPPPSPARASPPHRPVPRCGLCHK